MTLAVGLALLAALFFGAGTALQAHAAARSRTARPPAARAGSVLHLQSLVNVMARPLWLVGTLLDWLGALAHIAALHFGPLTLVQPLALTAIVWAVLTEALLSRRHPSGPQLAAAAETAFGLALITLCLSRDVHGSHVDALTSAAGVIGAALAIGTLALLATLCDGHRVQALLLGAAAGSAYGLSDAMMRVVQVPDITRFSGLVEVLAAATALTAGGIGLLLTQGALQKSGLSASMPAQDLLALLVSIAVGASMLGEVPHLTGTVLAGTAFALVLSGHGILRLARSLHHPTSEDVRGRAAAGRQHEVASVAEAVH